MSKKLPDLERIALDSMLAIAVAAIAVSFVIALAESIATVCS